jgi:hypothetical protein
METRKQHIRHPSPERYRTNKYRLAIGLAGAPAAWIILMSLANIISSFACYPHEQHLARPLWHGMNIWLVVLCFFCLVVGFISGAIAYTDSIYGLAQYTP